MVTTHDDKAHIHNHIYYNSTTLDCTRKFDDPHRSGMAVRRLSDRICLENGLSIIENPKKKGKHYAAWLGDSKPASFQEKLRLAIDAALEKEPDGFEAFLSLMEASGYEIKRGKHIVFKGPGQKRSTRLRSLKGDYTEEAIRERIEGKRIVSSGQSARANPPNVLPNDLPGLSLLIDLQNCVKAKNSPGYERWARIFNLKQLAQTFNFLQETGLTDYAVLKEKTAEAAARFHELSGRIKQAEGRMSEIAALQKHIGHYSRTREVYTQYRKAGYSKKFYAEHEREILLHKAAKQAFDAQNLKKLPAVKELKQEYAALLAEKKKLYQSYRKAKEDMRCYATAKANADRLLNYPSAQSEKGNREPSR